MFPLVLATWSGDHPLPANVDQAAYLLAAMGIGAAVGAVAGGGVFALAAALHLLVARGRGLVFVPAVAGGVVGIVATRLAFTSQTSTPPLPLQLLAGAVGLLFAAAAAWVARRFT